jgi:hypothetical protein
VAVGTEDASSIFYKFYLLYWYKSTNTDAELRVVGVGTADAAVAAHILFEPLLSLASYCATWGGWAGMGGGSRSAAGGGSGPGRFPHKKRFVG